VTGKDDEFLVAFKSDVLAENAISGRLVSPVPAAGVPKGMLREAKPSASHLQMTCFSKVKETDHGNKRS
jgi:hypothetical protein